MRKHSQFSSLPVVFAGALAMATSVSTHAGVPPGAPFQALQDQINALSQSVTQINAAVKAQAAQSSQTDVTVSGLVNDVATLKALLDTLSAELAAVANRTDENTADIATTQTDTATLKASVAGLSTQVQGLANNLASVFAQLDALNSTGLRIAVSYPRQLMTLDHAYRPSDLGCQSGFMCSSWQEITGGDMKYITLTEPTKLLITFTGNYNWDGGGSPVAGSVFTNSAIDIYPAGHAVPPLQEPSWGLDWRWIPNSGVNASFRKVVTLEPGQYAIRAKHRYQFSNAEISYFSQWTFFNGVITLESVE